ncbi:MAG: hypothetical protein ACI39G_02805 [Pseudoramibacter sp.]
MIDTDSLHKMMTDQHYDDAKMARKLGLTQEEFAHRMEVGIFGSDEIETMIEELDIADPEAIFFSRN